MAQFERNWNVFGITEPLLFPIKRAGQPEIHLAKLLKEFFEFKGGKCKFFEFNGEIIMKWDGNGNSEKWTISRSRGSPTPNAARKVAPNFHDLFLTIQDAELAQSLRGLLVNYARCEVDLAKIIGIGGEGTVLKEKKGLTYLFSISPSHKN